MSETKETYIALLKDILQQKEQILQAVLTLTQEQGKVLRAEEMSLDDFEAILPKKEKLINQLNKLDKGFDDVYKKVQVELQANKEAHKAEILELQEKIKKITDLGIKLQAEEQNNKAKLTVVLSDKRKQVRDFKISSRTASNYYKNMTGKPQGESYFMDKRK